ncbi:DMT family transporter [Shewanella maritima]|uniref:DMT family transporter n=1 Tax=Shewanella maritima TaxID=2520507 RepID=UPI003736FFC2
MYWVMLFIAGVFEVVWAIGLKQTDGFTKPFASVITLVALILSFIFLGFSMKGIPIAVAYAVWVAIGIVGTCIYSFMFTDDIFTSFKLISILLILAGITGLKLASNQ